MLCLLQIMFWHASAQFKTIKWQNIFIQRYWQLLMPYSYKITEYVHGIKCTALCKQFIPVIKKTLWQWLIMFSIWGSCECRSSLHWTVTGRCGSWLVVLALRLIGSSLLSFPPKFNSLAYPTFQLSNLPFPCECFYLAVQPARCQALTVILCNPMLICFILHFPPLSLRCASRWRFIFSHVLGCKCACAFTKPWPGRLPKTAKTLGRKRSHIDIDNDACSV